MSGFSPHTYSLNYKSKHLPRLPFSACAGVSLRSWWLPVANATSTLWSSSVSRSVILWLLVLMFNSSFWSTCRAVKFDCGLWSQVVKALGGGATCTGIYNTVHAVQMEGWVDVSIDFSKWYKMLQQGFSFQAALSLCEVAVDSFKRQLKTFIFRQAFKFLIVLVFICIDAPCEALWVY